MRGMVIAIWVITLVAAAFMIGGCPSIDIDSLLS